MRPGNGGRAGGGSAGSASAQCNKRNAASTSGAVQPLRKTSSMRLGILVKVCMCRLTTEIMIEEIGRRPGNAGGTVAGDGGDAGVQRNNADVAGASGAVAQDREGYALAAGLALGLITLGRGHEAAGLADLHIVDRLRCAPPGGLCAGALV